MTYAFEPVLTHIPGDLLLYRLRIEFRRLQGSCDCVRLGAADYRSRVAAEVLRAFGCPTPSELDELIEEGRAIGASVIDLALFIGREFRLKQLGRYSNSSN
jgi:hypothetical protein